MKIFQRFLVLFHVFLVILFSSKVDGLKWCEERNEMKERNVKERIGMTIKIKCYEEKEMIQLESFQCHQIHFQLRKERNITQIVFNENVKKEQIEIECEKREDDIEIIFAQLPLYCYT